MSMHIYIHIFLYRYVVVYIYIYIHIYRHPFPKKKKKKHHWISPFRAWKNPPFVGSFWWPIWESPQWAPRRVPENSRGFSVSTWEGSSKIYPNKKVGSEFFMQFFLDMGCSCWARFFFGHQPLWTCGHTWFGDMAHGCLGSRRDRPVKSKSGHPHSALPWVPWWNHGIHLKSVKMRGETPRKGPNGGCT